MTVSACPPGYTDPPWTAPDDFAAEVIPARAEALTEALNAALPEWMREAGLRFEWAGLSDPPSAYARVQSMISRGFFTLPSGRLDREAIMRALPAHLDDVGDDW